MSRFETLDLGRFPHRACVMGAAALTAFTADFVAKMVAVALQPGTLLFHVSNREPFGLGATLILVLVSTSLLACVLPARLVAVGAGVALGGAGGNLASRYWSSERGGSPDFIPFGDGSTGNVADLFIALGIATMLIATLVWLGSTVITTRRHARSAG